MLGRLLRRWSGSTRPAHCASRSRLRPRLTTECLESRTLLAGSPPLPEITVLDGGTSILNGSAAAIDIGTVTEGRTGPTHTFTVRNDGTAALTLGSITPPAGFSLVEGLYPSLVPRSSDTFTVRVDASGPGTKSGEISFRTNDPDEDPFHFAIGGTVRVGGPEITVLDGGTNIADGSTDPIDLGVGVLSQNGLTRTFTVRNDGTSRLTLGRITLPTGFTLVDELVRRLAPNTSDTFTIRLDSTAPGLKSGLVQFDTNDADENPFDFVIRGVVSSLPLPEIMVLDRGVNLVSGTVTPIEFGSVPRGQLGPTRTFTVRNDGRGTLTISSVTLPAGFALVTGLNRTTLAPRSSETFTVRLASATAGTSLGEIQIASDDADESLFRFTISGTVLS